MKNMLRSMDSKTTFSGSATGSGEGRVLTRRAALRAGRYALAGGALALGGFASGGAFGQTTSAETQPVAANQVLGDMELGAADAPVTIIEYSSLTCPHCARFHNTTLPDMKAKYIETGKVRFIYRDFPLDGMAVRAALLSRCGGEARRDGFLTVLFQQQPQWTQITSLEDLDLKLGRIGKLGGVSEADYQACMANSDLEDAVLKNRLSGESEYQVNSTPTFIVNGVKYDGALTIDMFDAIIEPLIPGS